MKHTTAVQVYQSGGNSSFEVRVQRNTVWLSLEQMAKLFQVDRTGIARHLKNIFETKELERPFVAQAFLSRGSSGKTYKTEYYNLDAILSVGYRVNSKEGTRFRIWATQVLKTFLLADMRQSRKSLQRARLSKLEQTFALVERAMQKELSTDEAKGLLHVIKEYAKSWATLQQFDDGKLPAHVRTTRKLRDLTEQEAEKAVYLLSRELGKKNEASDLFAREQRAGGLRSILRNIHQTFDGKALYMSVEERAAHLLYFVIKDHPFIDGNKRIGSLLFIIFLKRHGKSPEKLGITDAALVAIALLIAQSKPQEKEAMIALVQHLL